MKRKLFCVLALALSAWTADASATNVVASMHVTQGGLSWDEDMTSLVNQLNSGSFGEPDMYYSVSAINNSSQARTYSFSVGSAITPVAGYNAIYTDLSGSLTGARGVLKSIAPVIGSGIQRVELSPDNGATFFNAGVSVGLATSTSSTNALLGLYSATNPNGPNGLTWNYMRLVSDFTLTGQTAASLSGYAMITPVPEPLDAVMMLTGLGVVGVAVRFRRKGVLQVAQQA